MLDKAKTKEFQKSRSLTVTLAVAFITLSTVALLIASGVELYFNIRSEQEVVAAQQRFIALEAANSVRSFIQERFGELESVVEFGDLFDPSPVTVELTLEQLLGLEPAFRQVAFLNEQGRVLAQASRLSQVTENEVVSRLEAKALVQTEQGERYISPVYIDEITFEPLIAIAIPATDILGDFQGTLVAEVNLKFMWDLVGQLGVGNEGLAYVVDRQGNLLAFEDITRVLGGENLSHVDEVADFASGIKPLNEIAQQGVQIHQGINGTNVLSQFVPLGTPDWAVIVEIPVAEAYYGRIIESALSFALIAISVALLAGVVGAYFARRLAAPVRDLTDTASSVAAGNLHLRAKAEGSLEVRQLADAFNQMTSQLNDLIQSLEGRVVARTRRLEIVAALSERLVAILEVDQLLNELVNWIKESFGYYHAHVYLVDEQAQKLIMTAGAGEVGLQMKAQGHSIKLDAPTSLVARAARTKEVVQVNNVREAEDWLPNPLLPNTYSEMAVPIILEGQVVGVLDVQQDTIAGLDESDASLLRSLANQAAVALRNARLFAEVESALADARAVQARYIEESWDKIQLRSQETERLYIRPGAPDLSEENLTEAKQQALRQEHPALIALQSGASTQSIVAPVVLGKNKIGALQLHQTESDKTRTWTKDDLALVEIILDQVAQTAENLRLFDETRRRADYERLAGEITQKIRQAPSLEMLAQTAAEALSEVLDVPTGLVSLNVMSPQGTEKIGTNGQTKNPK